MTDAKTALRRIGAIAALTLAGLWALPTLFFMVGGGAVGMLILTAFLAGTAVMAWKRPAHAWIWVCAGTVVGTGWFLLVQPRADRQWRVESARQPTARRDGDLVTIHDVRNFTYRSVDDFDVRYEDRTYDLTELDSVDLLMCYWDGNTRIAHTMLSFGFGDECLCLSVEIRPELGEDWSALGAQFKQFEIIYVFADERDAVGVRTAHRGEDVYIYPLSYTPEQIRAYFELVIDRCNELSQAPEFYDPIDYNCSSALTLMADELWPDRKRQAGMDAYLNGDTARNAYDGGLIVSELPFEELRDRSRIAPTGRESLASEGFSARIRAGLPGR